MCQKEDKNTILPEVRSGLQELEYTPAPNPGREVPVGIPPPPFLFEEGVPSRGPDERVGSGPPDVVQGQVRGRVFHRVQGPDLIDQQRQLGAHEQLPVTVALLACPERLDRFCQTPARLVAPASFPPPPEAHPATAEVAGARVMHPHQCPPVADAGAVVRDLVRLHLDPDRRAEVLPQQLGDEPHSLVQRSVV